MRRAASALALCAGLLLAAGPAAAIRDLSPSATTKYFAQYAPTLYAAVQRAGLRNFETAIQAANLTGAFSSPLLSVTLLALDDAAWVDLAAALRPNGTLGDLFVDRLLVEQIVRAHMVDFPFFTNFWPPPGGLQLVNNMLDGRELSLGLDPGDSSKTPLVGGFQNSRPLAATAADLRAGASVMHVLSLQAAVPAFVGPQA